jgi:hypothetical protein
LVPFSTSEGRSGDERIPDSLMSDSADAMLRFRFPVPKVCQERCRRIQKLSKR